MMCKAPVRKGSVEREMLKGCRISSKEQIHRKELMTAFIGNGTKAAAGLEKMGEGRMKNSWLGVRCIHAAVCLYSENN